LLRTTFWLIRLVVLLTALSVTAVAISVALVAARTSVQLGMNTDTEVAKPIPKAIAKSID